MEKLRSLDLTTSLHPQGYSALMEACVSLISEKGHKVYGDEASDDDITGARCSTLVIGDKEGHKGSVQVTLYTQDAQKKMSAIVSEEIGAEVDALGHIEFDKHFGERMGFSGAFYALSNSTIICKATAQIESENVLDTESNACYEFAETIGIGSVWVDSMFRAVEQNVHDVHIFPINDRIAATVFELLTSNDNLAGNQ